VAGVALAVAALTREMALYVVPAAALWLARGAGGREGRRGAFVLSFVVIACILPWTLRNYRLHGRFVLISTNRWYPVAEGNLIAGPDPVEGAQRVRELRRRYYGNPNEISREAEARDIALRAIREQQPWWVFRKALVNTCLVFAPSRSQLARFLDQGWLQPRWRPVATKLLGLEAALYCATMLVGVAALWLVPDARLKWLSVSFLLVFLTVYMAGNAAHRFRVPMLPLLSLYTGPLLCGRGIASPARLLGAFLSVGAFLAVIVADLAGHPVVLLNQY
jgi:hypothetical protein